MMELENISIQQGTFLLENINFIMPEGAYAVLMGPTGCGKTTVLELFCGLRSPVSGTVRLRGTDVTHLAPGARQIGYVPQDHVLFPQLTVREQLGFALEMRKWSKTKIRDRVESLAERLGIDGLLERYPDHLSGGESQRVALGRALAAHPAILCLDEPLSALDEDTHDDLMNLLQSLHRSENLTILHITHSRSEADRLATRRYHFHEGTIIDEEKDDAYGL